MPALVCRTRPARSISRCETISASAGFSFKVGRKYWLIRMAADCRERAVQRQTEPFRWLCTGPCPHTATGNGGDNDARTTVQIAPEPNDGADRDRGRYHDVPDDGLHHVRQP